MLSSHNEFPGQLRLYLEEVCCDLCRFEHSKNDGVAPDQIRVLREVAVGPQSFADIRVDVPGSPPYFIEVKYGYGLEEVQRSLARKYGDPKRLGVPPSKIVLVVERAAATPDVVSLLQKSLGSLPLEVWTDETLLAKAKERYGLSLDSFSLENLGALRAAIEQAKGRFAFGESVPASALTSMLLWHFSFWRLKQLREELKLKPEEILREGRYTDVVVLMADLCSFSSYTRDTHDPAVIRESLTSFYSKARYAVANCGGMLYHFVGDEVIALFGMPRAAEEAPARAMACARALVDIGSSVSNEWQRRIDRVQQSGGVHMGVAVGDLELVALRPFSRSHVGLLGDPINTAARLMSSAGPSELVASNTFYNDLPPALQASFKEAPDLDAKNIGRIKAWRLSFPGAAPRPPA